MLNRTLLNAFRHELRFLREVGAEFAAAYPQFGGALATDAEGAGDPFVERLLEGVAFLTAKTACRLDAEGERLASDVLRATMPDLLHPLPPAAMVQFRPIHSLLATASARVPRGSALNYRGDSGQTIAFRSVSEVELLPLQLRVLPAPEHTLRQHVFQAPAVRQGGRWLGQCDVVRVELSTLEGQSLADSLRERLPIHFSGPDAFTLWSALTQHAQALLLVNPEQGGAVVAQHAQPRLLASGWRDNEALLPDDCVLPGPYRLLREWAHWPERFACAQVQALPRSLAGFQGTRLELWWLVRKGAVPTQPAADSMRLFCTPAVNVERLRCDPVTMSPNTVEYPAALPALLAQRYRIMAVDRVSCRTGNARWRELRPLHQMFRSSGVEHYAVRVLPRWSTPLGRAGAAELEWLVAPSVQANPAQPAGDVLAMDVWASRVSVSEVLADDASRWRLEHSAPVLGVDGVGFAVAGQSVPVASSAMLRSALARFEQLMHLPPEEAAQTLQQWLSGICDGFFLPAVQALRMTLAVRCAPWASRPVHAQGLQLSFEMDPLTEADERVSGWLHIVAATVARQLSGQAFVCARCMVQDRQLAECVVWQ